MYQFGELPSDIDDMDDTLGPPPAWFRSEQSYVNPSSYYYTPGYNTFYGLGDREQEPEANPIEELQELKYKQELNRKIPSVAYRYTAIDPLSPMFRDRRTKYGYGGLGEDGKAKKAVLPLLIAGVAFWFLFLRKTA